MSNFKDMFPKTSQSVNFKKDKPGEFGVNTEMTGNAYWESEYNKINENPPRLGDRGQMYRGEDELFRYSLNMKDVYNDPTILTFNLKFDTEASPLFNYGKDLDIIKDFKNNSYSLRADNSVLSFLLKYQNIPDIKKRLSLYKDFIRIADDLFNRTISFEHWKMSYYIQDIIGLDKLNAKMVKSDDKITISMSEDVSLRISYLSELYNNLLYSYKNQRYMVPENCLRFDIMLEITDIRIFRNIEKDFEGNIISTIVDEPPKIIYTLHDCNFDFSNSIPFEQSIVSAGFNQGTPNKIAGLKFDIKYKSISKDFKSLLIPNSLSIHNKLDKLVNEGILSKTILFKNDIMSDTKFSEKQDQTNFSYNNTRTTFSQNVYGDNKSLSDKALASLDKVASETVDELKNKVKQKYNDLRGKYITGLLNDLRGATGIPEIYPENVYDPDFRKLSIENFSKGLLTKATNAAQDLLGGAALGATDLPF